MYTIKGDGFRIEEITNGSVYIGKENDGAYSIYSVDAVVRFYFLVWDEAMTDIIIFPWYHMRFDPSKNADLKNADLLRVVTVFDRTSNMGLQFFNPRSTKTNTPFTSNILGSASLLTALQHYLKAHLNDREEVDRKYNQAQIIREEPSSMLFINKEKKNFFFKLHLYNALSRIVDPNANVDTAIRDVQKIFNDSASLGINSDVKAILREFLTDSRFVIYGGEFNQGFEKMYSAVAELLGIAPKTEQTLIFQKLSDAYLTNIINIAPLDTYNWVAKVLENTLTVPDDQLKSKDYLDISLYAHTILNDSFDRWKDEKSWTGGGANFVTLESTYTLVSTLFQASKKYYDHPDQASRKDIALTAFASQLYVPILRDLTNGIYSVFIQVQDWRYFLKPAYIKPNESANIDRDIFVWIADVVKRADEANNVFGIVKDRSVERENLTTNYTEMLDLTKKLQRVSNMIQDYRSYKKNPDIIDEYAGIWNIEFYPDSGEIIPTWGSVELPIPEWEGETLWTGWLVDTSQSIPPVIVPSVETIIPQTPPELQNPSPLGVVDYTGTTSQENNGGGIVDYIQ